MRRLWCVVFSLLCSPDVLAGLEMRAHHGVAPAPNGFNDQMEVFIPSQPDLGAPQVMGADAMFYLPFTGLGAGLRYETWKQDAAGQVTVSGVDKTSKPSLKASRVSVLGGYRFVSLPFFHLGILANYAVSQKLTFNQAYVVAGVETSTDYSGDMDTSYGVGVDVGVNLVGILIGGEVGYGVLKAKTLTDSSGQAYNDSANNPFSIDYSGLYYKVYLGYSLF